MLNEVTKLCKGNFCNLVKEYEVHQRDEFSSFVIATFDYKYQAEQFLKDIQNKNKALIDEYTIFDIEEVRY